MTDPYTMTDAERKATKTIYPHPPAYQINFPEGISARQLVNFEKAAKAAMRSAWEAGCDTGMGLPYDPSQMVVNLEADPVAPADAIHAMRGELDRIMRLGFDLGVAKGREG